MPRSLVYQTRSIYPIWSVLLGSQLDTGCLCLHRSRPALVQGPPVPLGESLPLHAPGLLCKFQSSPSCSFQVFLPPARHDLQLGCHLASVHILHPSRHYFLIHLLPLGCHGSHKLPSAPLLFPASNPVPALQSTGCTHLFPPHCSSCF